MCGLLVLSTVLMAASSATVRFKPREAGFAVVSVAQRGAAEFVGFFRRAVTAVRELKRLRTDYDSLQEELARYRMDSRELVQLRQENDRLKDLLGFSKTLSFEHVAAEVIGRDPGNAFASFVIDKGTSDGVYRDMPVVAYQNGLRALVGKVRRAGPVSALVLPLFDVSCHVSGRLQDERYSGLVSGRGEPLGNLLMTAVPKSARDSLKVGDLVTTSGLSTIYPKGIYIGRIREIGAKAWEASLQLELEPIVDFSRLEYVFILDTLG